MQAGRVCHKWLENVMPGMHRRRLSAICAVVVGALRGGRLNVTSLGRSLDSQAKVKHNIKRADRLFSNEHLQKESTEVYSQLSKSILAKARRPVILIDWSDIDARMKFFLLRASVAVKGRSLTLYEEIHELSTKEKPKTHKRFLSNLKMVLPPDCKPIIVTDAGFRVPWFKQVLAVGWDYVGRVRNRENVELAPKTGWRPVKSLYPEATPKPKLFSNVSLTRSNELRCSLLLYKAKSKGRVRLTKMGRKARAIKSLKNSARSKEPWLLATSLGDDATRAVEIYSKRMQIEETFRDLKCPRLGLGLYHNGTYMLQRMKILVLIGSLTNIFAWLLGYTTRSLQLHRQFQANTVRKYQVLSNVFLGMQVFRRTTLKIPWKHFKSVQTSLLPVFCLSIMEK